MTSSKFEPNDLLVVVDDIDPVSYGEIRHRGCSEVPEVTMA